MSLNENHQSAIFRKRVVESDVIIHDLRSIKNSDRVYFGEVIDPMFVEPIRPTDDGLDREEAMLAQLLATFEDQRRKAERCAIQMKRTGLRISQSVNRINRYNAVKQPYDLIVASQNQANATHRRSKQQRLVPLPDISRLSVVGSADMAK
jgi:hypothetical protein